MRDQGWREREDTIRWHQVSRNRPRLRDFRAAVGTHVRTLREKPPLVSVVTPVYHAEEIVPEFVRMVKRALEPLTEDYEIVLVEDGSADDTWGSIQAQCAADRRVKGIKLSRNFGQHPAITAGLDFARGRWVVVMDCDLQDDPAFIPALYTKAAEGHDVVLTVRETRAHGALKNALARLYALALNRFTGEKTNDPLVGGYSLLSRRAVEAFRTFRDVHRHYLVIVRWLGFPTAYVPVAHRERYRGRSSYTLMRLLRHAMNGWVANSNRLLYLSVAIGFAFLVASFAGVALVAILYFTRGFAPGWPSVVVLLLVSTGLILLSLGVIGTYIGKIFDQVRQRPLYLVDVALNASSRASDGWRND
jgi:polyisoprenyl-phosphate glycosyltransferase